MLMGLTGALVEGRLPYPGQLRQLTGYELLALGFPHLMSLVWRRQALPSQPGWFFEVAMGDYPTWLLLAKTGPILFLRDSRFGTLRINPERYWRNRPFVERTKDELAAFECFVREFGSEVELGPQ